MKIPGILLLSHFTYATAFAPPVALTNHVPRTALFAKPEITISGGGVSGLALALDLNIHFPDAKVKIIERNPYPNDVGKGTGLNLQPHAMQAMDKLGVMEEAMERAWVPLNQQYYTSDGRLIANAPRGGNMYPKKYPQLSIHRMALHEILEEAVRDRLGPECIDYETKALSYTQTDDKVTLTCADKDGKEFQIESDILIGSDGLHSRVRKQLVSNYGGEDLGPVQSGINVYRGTAMTETVLDGRTMIIAGMSNAKLVAYPLEKMVAPGRTKQLLNFVVEVQEKDEEVPVNPTQEELADHCANQLEKLNDGFNLPFLDHRKMLKLADNLRPFDMSDKDPIYNWSDGRVVLLGDAAHPMYPVGSNGASSALLDPLVLVRRFTEVDDITNKDDIAKAFKSYEDKRMKLVTDVQKACRKMMPEQILDKVAKTIPKGEAIQVPGPLEDEVQAALKQCQAGWTVERDLAEQGFK